MKTRRIVVSTGAAVAAAALVGAGVTPAFATGGGGPVAASILGSGSDTTQFMMDKLDSLYRFSPGCNQLAVTPNPQWLDFSCGPDTTGTVTSENYAHDQVTSAYFLGSSVGINQLCDQGQAGVAHVDYARSSRAVVLSGTGQDCHGERFVAYARDAISWEAFDKNGYGVHSQNNTTAPCPGTTTFCLTQQQLKDIFINCTAGFWDSDGIGGQHVAIQIYTPQAGSGTRKTWDKFLGGDSSHCIPTSQLATHVVPENSNTAIKSKPGAIFPFSFGIWSTQVKGKGGAILGGVDGVQPTVATIQDSSFVYGRFLFNVYCDSGCSAGASSAQAVNYVGEEGWICKATGGSGTAAHAADPVTGVNYFTEIQSAISASGFVPLTNGVIGGGDLNSDFCRLTTAT